MAGQYLATVTGKEQLAPDIFRLTVRAPEIAHQGRPGQFVMLRAGRGLDPLLNRPFSLHWTTAEGDILVLFKVIGRGTRWLAELSPGDPLAVVGPLGRGFSLDVACQRRDRLTLVGGGMGTAPLYLLAREIRRQNPAAPVDILLGARHAQELTRLLADFQSLGFAPRVATDDGSLGHHGLVPDLLDHQFPGGPGKQERQEMQERQEQQGEPAGMSRRVYCCGPWPMMAAVAAKCAAHGWACQVSLETMMACGFSACLGCAVRGRATDEHYLHVCKDGPVFAAEQIDWLPAVNGPAPGNGKTGK